MKKIMDYHSKSYILQTILKTALEVKEHPEAKDCIEFVCDFLNQIHNENILKECIINWDDTNKGFLLLWDDSLPKYQFKAEVLVCDDYANYSYVIRDKNGFYLDSSGGEETPYLSEGIGDENRKQYPHYFWKDIVKHIEMIYKNEELLTNRIF